MKLYTVSAALIASASIACAVALASEPKKPVPLKYPTFHHVDGPYIEVHRSGKAVIVGRCGASALLRELCIWDEARI